MFLTKSTKSTPNPPRQLNILLHDSNPLRMNSAQISVFEEVHHERLRRLLKSQQGLTLPPHRFIRSVELGVYDIDLVCADFSDETGEWEFAKQ